MNIGLIKYLKLHGYTQIFCDNKLDDINNILDKIDINKLNNIFIIGLDGGFIADFFLNKNENINITVFDKDTRIYNHISEEYLYIKYNDRLTINYSDIFEYCKNYRGAKYDLIFINSDRSQKKNIDYINLTKNLSNNKTKIIMTNTSNNNNGAHKCWNKMVSSSMIKEVTSTYKNKKNGLDISLGLFL